jgi:hypothetical protein
VTCQVVSIVACCGVLLSSVSAAAQDYRAARPYQGLFGGDGSNAAQVLSVNGAAGIGYDTDVLAEQREEGLGTVTPVIHRRGDLYNVFAGGLAYAGHGGRYDMGASLSSLARHYSQYSTVSSHAASVAAGLRITRGTTLTGSQTATYQPWGALFRFPALNDAAIGQIEPPSQDFAVVRGAYSAYSTAATVTQQVSRRSSLSATYNYQVAKFTGLNGDFRSQVGLLRYTHGLTRNMGWHAAYGYSEARYLGQGTFYRGRIFDTGLDYTRNLSITRRTRLSFSTGASEVKEREFTRYTVTGTATLNREIGRTWDAGAMYTRNVAFVETLHAPYFYDAINIGFSGLISRRAALHSWVGATFGDVGINTAASGSNRFDTGYSTTGFVVALSRYLAIATDYVFYAYSLDRASLIASGLPPQLGRHSIVVALRAWAPIVEHGRRSNAAR